MKKWPASCASASCRRQVGGWLLAFWLSCSVAHAQYFRVIEISPEDALAADKLRELIAEPFERHSGETAEPCASGVQFALLLDGAHDMVRLLRCRDGTTMTRTLDPSARSTPYVEAFVAAELLALNGELENVVIEPPRGPPQPTAAGTDSAVQPPAATQQQSSSRWRLRLGAEWLALGEPFAGALRPQLGLGLALGSGWPRIAWVLELHVSIFAHGEVAGPSPLELTRNDAQLRAGLAYTLGRWTVLGTLLGRASLTSASHAGDSSAALRWGVGVGAELDLALLDWAHLYASLVLDRATSQSEYRVDGIKRALDPAVLLSCSLGILVMGWL